MSNFALPDRSLTSSYVCSVKVGVFSHNRLSGIQPVFPASAYRFFTRFSKCKSRPTHVLEPGTSISCVVGITWGRVGADTGLSVVCVYGATFSLCQNTCFSYICTTQASSGVWPFSNSQSPHVYLYFPLLALAPYPLAPTRSLPIPPWPYPSLSPTLLSPTPSLPLGQE